MNGKDIVLWRMLIAIDGCVHVQTTIDREMSCSVTVKVNFCIEI